MAQGNEIRHTKEQITDAAVKDCNCTRVAAGTVLLSFKLSVGKVGIAQMSLFTNEAIAALPIKDRSRLDAKFLTYALRSARLQDGTDRASMGATLNKAKLEQIAIILPPIEQQRRIAAVLDQAEALRAKRRQALAKLDTLTQSLFLEMFGDPLSNPLNWPIETLGNVAAFENGDRSGNYPSGDDLKTAGVLFLNGKNIVDHRLNLESSTYIEEAKFNSLSRGKARNGDLIITLRGTLGNCCVFESVAGKAFINAQMMIVRPSQHIRPAFLHALLTSKGCNAKLQEMSSGVAVPQLTAAQLRALRVILPPEETQEQFGALLYKLNLSRTNSLASQDATAKLFTSIQHQAFEGTL